jgi:hypothetical protein
MAGQKVRILSKRVTQSQYGADITLRVKTLIPDTILGNFNYACNCEHCCYHIQQKIIDIKQVSKHEFIVFLYRFYNR